MVEDEAKVAKKERSQVAAFVIDKLAPLVGHNVLYFAYIDSLLSLVSEVVLDTIRVRGIVLPKKTKIARRTQLTDKLIALRAAFEEMEHLSTWRAEALALIGQIETMKSDRDQLAHGGIDLLALKREELKFTSWRPSKRGDTFEGLQATFTEAGLRKSAVRLAELAARLTMLLADLHEGLDYPNNP